MPREDRRISNIKQDSINEINYYPSRQSVSEGDIVISHPKGKPLRLYKKLNGILWWSDFTRDGKQYFDNDLIYKGYLRNSNYPAFSVYQGDSAIGQTIANNTRARLVFDTSIYDVGSNFDTSAYKFTAPVSGIYHFDIKLLWDNDKDLTAGDWTAEERHDIQIFKNDTQGATKSNTDDRVASNLRVINGTITDYFAMNNLSVDMKLNSGDYIEVVGYQNSGTNQYTYESNDPEWTAWTGHLITAI